MTKTYKVYIKVDKNNSIIEIFSSYFKKPSEEELEDNNLILIDEGKGNRYIYVDNWYNTLFTFYGQPRYFYKRESKTVLVRKKEDIDKLYPIEITPTDLDKLDARITYLEMVVEPSVVILTEDETIHSPMFDKLKFYYETKLWTAEMIQLAVTYKRIMQAECDEILSLQTGGETV